MLFLLFSMNLPNLSLYGTSLSSDTPAFELKSVRLEVQPLSIPVPVTMIIVTTRRTRRHGVPLNNLPADSGFRFSQKNNRTLPFGFFAVRPFLPLGVFPSYSANIVDEGARWLLTARISQDAREKKVIYDMSGPVRKEKEW